MHVHMHVHMHMHMPAHRPPTHCPPPTSLLLSGEPPPLTLTLTLTLTLILPLTQASRSLCGAPCGYLVYHHTAPNPADALLLAASALFPLDAGIVLMLLLLMPLGAVLAASHRTGVRFLCMRLWPLRVRGSAAPAVTLAVL